MSSKDHVAYLRSLGACAEAIRYAQNYPSLQTAWDVCERGDWMLWLLGKQITSAPWSEVRKPLLTTALDCADTVAELRPMSVAAGIAKTITVLRGWIAGEMSEVKARQARWQLRSMYYAADAATAATATATAATAAAAVVVAVVVAATTAAADAAADAAAADAAAAAATTADAAAAARSKKLQECADIVRRHFPTPTYQKEII